MMADLPEPLRYALAARLAGLPIESLRTSVNRLIEAYRSGTTPATPILSRPGDVAAYAAYRMPATFSAVRAALAAVDVAVPPATLLDLGGGTGAAAWAAVDRWPEIREITVIDQVRDALDLGAGLAAESPSPALRAASWVAQPLGGTVPSADLVTISYVLGELDVEAQRQLVDTAATAGGVVVIVEPGTPAGYARILAARARLIESGRVIVAPCPHQAACPMPPGKDWCHFGARVNRSALHRKVKDADLSYEDEKFSYLVAVRPEFVESAPQARVLRRPIQRKGLVQLHLCQPAGTIADQIVTKRHGSDYKLARDVSWGDTFPV
jgi:ribosomal protein RSM22 (predicted rRNA methylase)